MEQEGGPKEPEKGSEAMVLGGQDFNVEQGAMEREGNQERPDVGSGVAVMAEEFVSEVMGISGLGNSRGQGRRVMTEEW